MLYPSDWKARGSSDLDRPIRDNETAIIDGRENLAERWKREREAKFRKKKDSSAFRHLEQPLSWQARIEFMVNAKNGARNSISAWRLSQGAGARCQANKYTGLTYFSAIVPNPPSLPSFPFPPEFIPEFILDLSIYRQQPGGVPSAPRWDNNDASHFATREHA